MTRDDDYRAFLMEEAAIHDHRERVAAELSEDFAERLAEWEGIAAASETEFGYPKPEFGLR